MMRRVLCRYLSTGTTSSTINKLKKNNNAILMKIKSSSNSLSSVLSPSSSVSASSLLRPGQQVMTQIVSSMDGIGFIVSIEGTPIHGLITLSEINYLNESRGRHVKYGDKIEGFVGKIQQDGNVSILCRPRLGERLPLVKSVIMDVLSTQEDGSAPIGDKSSSEDILRLFPGLSKSDFKKAIGSLYSEDLIELGPNHIKLRNQSDKISAGSSRVDPEVSQTLYLGNIHPDTKDINELRSFLNDIFRQSPVIYTHQRGLHLKNPKDKTDELSHFEVKRIRLKPVFTPSHFLDGQTVGSTPSDDRYQKRDGRTGFIDISWSGSVIGGPTVKSNKLVSLEEQISTLAIGLLNRKIFRGKKIKVNVAMKRDSSPSTTSSEEQRIEE